MLSGTISGTFSAQRDVPLVFQDYTSQVQRLGKSEDGPFTRPDVVSNLVGSFESRYDIYDLDITLADPGRGTDHVGFGMADYAGLFNSGEGSGTAGVRRPTGDSVLDATGVGWSDQYDAYSAASGTAHEVGHAFGVPHARHPLDAMAYDGQSNLNVVGSYFPFPWTDSRVPEVELLNKRDYLDWTLQAGRIAREVEPNDSVGTAMGTASLNPILGRRLYTRDCRCRSHRRQPSRTGDGEQLFGERQRPGQSCIGRLRNGGGLNLTYRLTSTTVLSDGAAIDTLLGEAELDWFWKFGGDTSGDLVVGETVN